MPRQSRAIAALSLMSTVAAFSPVVLPPVDKYGAQTVTAADQVVYLPGYEYATSTQSYSDNVVTTVCPEACPSGKVVGWEDSFVVGSPIVIVYRYDVAYEEVYEKEISCPYSQVGPYAFPGFQGSGLCDDCDSHQTGYVKECYNNNCAAYSCGWGSDYSHQCENYSKPNGYIVAPAGCQNVCANYEDCYGGYCTTKQSCYTVPWGGNFPPIYPPGFCHECQLPPGWTTIVTVLPDATVTTTLTVPTTVTDTATTTVTTGTSTPIALACPGSNNQIFVGNSGSTFQIRCDVGITGTEINARDVEERSIFARALGTTGNFNQCIQLCDDNSQCDAVTYNPDTGVCRGFEDATATTSPNGDYVAILIQRANGATSTTSSTSSSSSMETDTTSTTSSTSSTTSTSSSATATPSDNLNARDVRGDNLVPKRFARKAAHIRL